MEEKDIKALLDELKTKLENSTTEKAKAEIEKQIKALEEKIKPVDLEPVNKELDELKKWKVEKDEADKKNQEAMDKMIAEKSKRIIMPDSNIGFADKFKAAFHAQVADQFESQKEAFNALATGKDKKARVNFNLDLKTVANMTVSGHLTGEGQVTYNPNQGLIPNDSVNFRDLIPTTSSPTGIYVSYRETTSEGSISVQTEGSAKTQIDYDLSRVSVVSDYIAGWLKVSKQMMFQLPWLQGTLPRLLLRDFYKKENTTFYSAAYSAATGNDIAPASATNDSEELLHWIANQRDANFNASFVLISWADWAHLLTTQKSTGAGYGVPGGWMFDTMGNMRIAGVPIVAAPWVTDGECLIIDRNFIERVETESLRVEFSYEDDDNFQKNLVTVRVECFEDINLLRTDAHIAAEFGGS